MSLKTKITLMVSIQVIVLLTAMFAVTTRYAENEMKRTITHQQTILLSEIVNDFDEEIQTTSDTLAKLAAKVPLQLLYNNAAAQRWINNAAEYDMTFDDALTLIRADQGVIAESPKYLSPRALHPVYQRYFKKTIESAAPQISEPFALDDKVLMPRILFTAPVKDSSGRMAAVLIGSFDLTQNNFLGKLSRIKIGQGGYISLFTRSGMLIVARNKSRILKKDRPLRQPLNLRAMQGFDGTAETVNSSGVRLLATVMHLHAVDWIMKISYPIAEAYAPIRRAQRYCLAGGIIAIVVSLIIVWVLTRRLTRPLMQFTRHVEQLANGEASGKQIAINTGDEIETLATAFNAMVAELSRKETKLHDQLGRLQESEERFRQIFEQNSDAVMLLHRGSPAILDVNPAAVRLYGFTREELLDSGVRLFMDPAASYGLKACVDEQNQVKAPSLERVTTYKKDGARLTASIKAEAIRLRDMDVLYCSFRDVTEAARLEEEMRVAQARLITANKMASLGMLLSGAAHEINNPNNFIAVNATLLNDIWRDADPILARHLREVGDFQLAGLSYGKMRDKVPRLINGLKEGSQRINAIVTELKEFARNGQSRLDTVIDINAVVRGAITILGHHIHCHTDAFEFKPAEFLPGVRGSSQLIEQVVINLLMNALQALPDKEHGVTIETLARPEAVLVIVRDEGRGMTPEVMAHLAEPFFTTRLDEGGTGLGLSISFSIVKEHKGTLEFDSQPGVGARATLSLPLASSGEHAGQEDKRGT